MQNIITVAERHGLLIVFLNVLLSQGGLPLPVVPTLMTVAALASQSPYQIIQIILAGVSGTLIAEAALYWVLVCLKNIRLPLHPSPEASGKPRRTLVDPTLPPDKCGKRLGICLILRGVPQNPRPFGPGALVHFCRIGSAADYRGKRLLVIEWADVI
jgi:hypothetical protein